MIRPLNFTGKRHVILEALPPAVLMRGDWHREVFGIYRYFIEDGTLMETFHANMNPSARTLIGEARL
jgi:hypothetical protein